MVAITTLSISVAATDNIAFIHHKGRHTIRKEEIHKK